MEQPQFDETPQPFPKGCLYSLLGVGCLVVLCCCSGVSYLLGNFWGYEGAYHNRYREERAVIAPILANDQAFAAVEMTPRSNGGVLLHGLVPTPEDRERLRTSIARALGESRSRDIVGGIDVTP